MRISNSPIQAPIFGIQESRQKPASVSSEDPTEKYEPQETRNPDRALAIGALAATVGAVVYAGCQGNGAGALLGAAVAGASGMVAGVPLSMAGRPTTAAQIGNYFLSSAATLTLGVAAGAFMGAQGHGLLAAVGAGTGAALLGRLGAQFL